MKFHWNSPGLFNDLEYKVDIVVATVQAVDRREDILSACFACHQFGFGFPHGAAGIDAVVEDKNLSNIRCAPERSGILRCTERIDAAFDEAVQIGRRQVGDKAEHVRSQQAAAWDTDDQIDLARQHVQPVDNRSVQIRYRAIRYPHADAPFRSPPKRHLPFCSRKRSTWASIFCRVAVSSFLPIAARASSARLTPSFSASTP